MGGLLQWYSEEGPGLAGAPPSPLLAVPNVTAHPSTASVPITVLFDVALWSLKGVFTAMPHATAAVD